MTKTIPVFYLFLLFLCNFIAVSLAVEASGGDDSGGGSPEESGGGGGGGAGGEQGRDEQLVVAAGEIRDHMQLKRQEFCLICIIAANRQLDISQLPEDSGNQAALIQYKMDNVLRARYADAEITQDNSRAECTNLLRDNIQQYLSLLIYMIPHGSEEDPFSNMDPYIRLLALERFRDHFGFDTQREYSCSNLFQRGGVSPEDQTQVDT